FVCMLRSLLTSPLVPYTTLFRSRTPIVPDARLPTRRTLDERLFVRWPGAYAAFSRASLLLPPRSRLRRALLRRATLSGWAAWARDRKSTRLNSCHRESQYAVLSV